MRRSDAKASIAGRKSMRCFNVILFRAAQICRAIRRLLIIFVIDRPSSRVDFITRDTLTLAHSIMLLPLSLAAEDRAASRSIVPAYIRLRRF